MEEHILWQDNTLILLDQRMLPLNKERVTCRKSRDVAAAIKTMVVRGAPAIGIAAAFGLVLASLETGQEAEPNLSARKLDQIINEAALELEKARPTAVNLAWAISRMLKKYHAIRGRTVTEIQEILLAEAKAIKEEDLQNNYAIGKHSLTLLKRDMNVLTYCNAGGLATGGYGTALGVIRAGFDAGKIKKVYACETRPFLQGSRLTAWELAQDNIPVILVTDNMAGYLMFQGLIDMIVVGADRITLNGDVINKIGTYTLAVLAEKHGIPFYAAAPLSTFDLSVGELNGIAIEIRDAREITHIGDTRIAPEGIDIYNPAFDITPSKLIDAIVTEQGVIREPYPKNILALFGKESN